MPSPKVKNVFPKLSRGGFSCRFGFPDESRGERFFDTEWGTHATGIAGSFGISHPLRHDGHFVHDVKAADTIGPAFTVGGTVSVAVFKWNRRGKSFVQARTIRVTSIEFVEGCVIIGYDNP